MKPFVVLHVEDDAGDRMVVASSFKKVAPTLVLKSVPDGAEAILYLSGQGVHQDREQSPIPNLVLLDLKLPKKSGHEVLEWIRGHADLKDLPVFMLTSSSDPADMQRATALGANSYLIKPVDLKATRDLVGGIGEYAAMTAACAPEGGLPPPV